MKSAKIKVEVDRWEQEQQYCDLANMIVRMLNDNQLTVLQSEKVLSKVQMAIGHSVKSTRVGIPFAYKAISNEFDFILEMEGVADEINRRKNRGVD